MSGSTRVSRYQKGKTKKVKTNLDLLEQEIVSGSGISWVICKSAPRLRQITMPAPHHSVLHRPDALPVAQPTVSKHWRSFVNQHSASEIFTITKMTKLICWLDPTIQTWSTCAQILYTHRHIHTQPFYSSLDFVWDNPGELVPEGTCCHLLHRESKKETLYSCPYLSPTYSVGNLQ